jgi:hypothetical protein
MEASLVSKLLVEEFIQMYELLRQREESMNQLLNLMATGTTTLLAAIAAFVLQVAGSSPDKLLVWHCYLLLLPAPLTIFGLSILTSHRDDIYKIGYYIKVFFEEKIGGAAWHIRLENVRNLGESQDPVLVIMWTLLAIMATLFAICLHLVACSSRLHLLSLIPFVIFMAIQHYRFMRSHRSVEQAWILVQQREGNLRP